MIAGFIFLRLRGILGKRTGFEGKLREEFKEEFTKNVTKKNVDKQNGNNNHRKPIYFVNKCLMHRFVIDEIGDLCISVCWLVS